MQTNLCFLLRKENKEQQTHIVYAYSCAQEVAIAWARRSGSLNSVGEFPGLAGKIETLIISPYATPLNFHMLA